MASFALTRKALADLLEIGRYTQEQWGAEQRTIYLTMLDACFQKLAVDPSQGKDCSAIREGYRKMRAGSHVVFYREKTKGKIEIVRILHAHMDFETRLMEN